MRLGFGLLVGRSCSALPSFRTMSVFGLFVGRSSALPSLLGLSFFRDRCFFARSRAFTYVIICYNMLQRGLIMWSAILEQPRRFANEARPRGHSYHAAVTVSARFARFGTEGRSAGIGFTSFNASTCWGHWSKGRTDNLGDGLCVASKGQLLVDVLRRQPLRVPVPK